jgi:hypothetical protein
MMLNIIIGLVRMSVIIVLARLMGEEDNLPQEDYFPAPFK